MLLVNRTPSAQFPMTRAPSRQGLAMITTTESSPPPTELAFEEALQLLHKLEKRLRAEMDTDLRELRLRMTAKKIDYVSRKAQRLYMIRQQLGACRVLCRQEEEVLREFDKVKVILDQQKALDEDDYQRTKIDCLVLGGKLTDIRRRQRRLSGQVEELESTVRELMDQTPMDDDDEEFDLELFKRKGLEDEPRLAPTLSSYSLFNNAPFGSATSPVPPIKITNSYSSDSLAFGATSDDGGSEIPERPSPIPPHLLSEKDPDYAKYYRGRDTTDVGTDVSQDEREESAYYPQASGAKRKKKKRSEYTARNRTESMSSDTDAEDWTSHDAPFAGRMSADEAKKVAEAKQRQMDEEKRREEAEQQRIRDEMEAKQREEHEQEMERLRLEEEVRKTEMEAKKKEDEERKKAELEAKMKAAEEKRKAFEDKKKAEAEAKKKEEEEKKKDEAEKKKKELEEKKQVAAEKKKALEENKKAEQEAKKKAEEEAMAKLEEERMAAEEQARLIEEEDRRLEVLRQEEEVQLLRQRELEEDQRLYEEEQMELRQREVEEDERRLYEENQGRIDYKEAQERLYEEEQWMEGEEPKKPSKKSRSASRDRQAASKAVKDLDAEDDDMIFDEEHQIKDKEDLFAMIGDTSLKGVRLRRKKASTGEESADEAPPKGTRSKKNSTSSTAQDDEIIQEPKSKTRTPSRDRQAGQQESDEAQKRAAKSRTTSRERPLAMKSDPYTEAEQSNLYSSTDSMVEKPGAVEDEAAAWNETDQEMRQISKSRSGSRGKGKSFEADQGAESYDTNLEGRTAFGMAEGDEELSAQEEGDWWGKKATPSSWQDDYGNEQEDERPFAKSRTGSGDRSTKGQRGLDLEFENESQLRSQKSRTASKERPKSSQEGEMGRPVTAKSRTASRERPDRRETFDPEEEAELKELEEVGFRRPSSRPASGLSHQEGQQRGLKSRTASGDRREREVQDNGEDYLEEDIEMAEAVNRPSSSQARPASRGAKSRTASGERPVGILKKSDYEEEDDWGAASGQHEMQTKVGQKSRTASRERPGIFKSASDQDEQMQQDELDSSRSRPDGESRVGQKSRTASRERPLTFRAVQQEPEEEDFEMIEPEQGLKQASRPESRQGIKSRTASRDRVSGRKVSSGGEENFEGEARGSRTQSRDRGGKSRTASGERIKDVQADDDEEFYEPEDYTSVLEDQGFEPKGSSRNSSRERPRGGGFADEEGEPASVGTRSAKSRTGSRDRGSDLQHYKAGEKDEIYAEVRPRRDRVTHSRTASGERPGSAPHSEGQPVGYDDEIDDEDVPALESATADDEQFPTSRSKRRTKSRTTSFERLSSQQQQQQQAQKDSRNDEGEFESHISEAETRLAQFEKKIKSRTASRERPQTLDLQHVDMEADFLSKQNRSRTGSRERPRARMSRHEPEDEDEEFMDMTDAGIKSRSASRDGRRGQYEEDEFMAATQVGQAKSRTGSRERPGSRLADMRQERLEAEELDEAEHPFAKSRTHSRERRKDEFSMDDDDAGYDTMGGRLRRYKDEEALDLAAADLGASADYDYDTLDSGISDFYRQGRQNYNSTLDSRARDEPDDDATPLTDEPNHLFINPEYDLDADYYQNEGGGNEEYDQQGRRTKKVSFAEADEKFVLRPDPEVKVIPGTKLFCFAPSETYEQPPETQVPRSPPLTNGASRVAVIMGASGASGTSGASPLGGISAAGFLFKGKEKEAEKAAPLSPQKLSPAKSEERQMSTSPKAFLKAMLGSGRSGSAEPGERRSLFDTLLRRGRSASLNNSRQNSLDRGPASERGTARRFSPSLSIDSALQQRRPPGINSI